MPYPEGPWFCYIKMAPSSFPNDGVVVIERLVGEDIDGFHYRPPFEKTSIRGHFRRGTTPGGFDQIDFEETYDNVTYTYEAVIVSVLPNYYITYNGKRRPGAGKIDDDWVGTHTT